LDAGRELLLLGDGKGGLRAMPGQESGIKVYGEQRGAAVGDFNEDGRADLAVTQNGARTKLFQNMSAKPGVRVRLKGGEGNPRAIGAVLRLKASDGLGPAREIHAGSGYLSQDGPVVVLSAPEPPAALQVRWPGGRTLTYLIPPDAREVTLDPAGKLTPSVR
jgi:hypothetical protein